MTKDHPGANQGLVARLLRLQPGLRAFIRARMGRLAASEDASDVKQSVFRRVLFRPEEYRLCDEDQLEAYVHRVAKQVLVDHYRYHARACRGGREPLGVGARDLGGLAQVQDTTVGPATRLMLDERRNRIRLAVAALPQTLRDVVHWRIFDDLSFAEIGLRQRRSEDAAKMAYHRAIAKISYLIKP